MEKEIIRATVQRGGYAARRKSDGQWLSITNEDGPWSTLLVMESKEMLLSYADTLGWFAKDLEFHEVLLKINEPTSH